MIDYLTRSLTVGQVQRTFIVHGDLPAAEAYRDHLTDAGFSNITIPEKGEVVEL